MLHMFFLAFVPIEVSTSKEEVFWNTFVCKLCYRCSDMPRLFLQPDSFNDWTVWEQNLLEPLALKLHSHHIKLIHMNGECVYLGPSEHLYQSLNSSLTLVEWRTKHLLQVGISYSRVSDPWENSYCGVHCPADQLLWNKWTGGPHTQGPIYFMTGMWPKLEVYRNRWIASYPDHWPLQTKIQQWVIMLGL